MNKKKKKRIPERRRIDKSQAEEYDYHKPVLLKECVDYLIYDKCGLYVDGTLGGGGHAAEILSRLETGGNLIAFDKDPQAIAHCRTRFEEELEKSPSKIELVNDCYSGACGIIETRGSFSGLLLDLGVSSMQLDSDSRGVSYRVDTRLDMRFGEKGVTAEELLNTLDEDEIYTILRDYGEEPNARAVARRIVEKRRVSAIRTVFELRDIALEGVPAVFHFKTLSRVFQAVRIAVNGELDVLKDALNGLIPLLNPGGRIVIMSYHSLEDRIVKQIFKEHSKREKTNKYSDNIISNTAPKLKLITPRPIIPTEEEILKNPRSRSAKLRVAERI